jgi:hypothetical protein
MSTSQLSLGQGLVRSYQFPVNDNTRNAFARYFAGFQRFIETGKGKKIGFELSNFNSTLLLNLFTDDQKDLDNMDAWVKEFIEQAIRFVHTEDLGVFKIQSGYEISEYDAKLTMVEQKGRIRDLESDLESANLKINQKEVELVKLNSIIDQKSEKIVQLQIQNNKLQDQIIDLMDQLILAKKNQQYNQEKIDILIGICGQIKLALSEKDDNLVNKATNELRYFYHKWNGELKEWLPIVFDIISKFLS